MEKAKRGLQMVGNYVNFIETVSKKVGLAELGNVLVEAYQDIKDQLPTG